MNGGLAILGLTLALACVAPGPVVAETEEEARVRRNMEAAARLSNRGQRERAVQFGRTARPNTQCSGKTVGGWTYSKRFCDPWAGLDRSVSNELRREREGLSPGDYTRRNLRRRIEESGEKFGDGPTIVQQNFAGHGRGKRSRLEVCTGLSLLRGEGVYVGRRVGCW